MNRPNTNDQMKWLFALALSLIAMFSSPKAQATFYDGFEGGNISKWTLGTGSYTREVSTASTAAGTTYSFNQTGGTGGTVVPFDGVSRSLTASTPNYISFYVKSAATAVAAGYFVVGDADITNNGGIIFFKFSRSGVVNLTDGAASYDGPAYATNTWYRIEFRNINWSSKTFDYYVNGALQKSAVPFRSKTTTAITQLHLFNVDYAQVWYDEIQIGGTPDTATPPVNVTATAGNGSATVSFTPASSGSGSLVKYWAACGVDTTHLTKATGSSSPITVTGLTNGTPYYCWAMTETSAGYSEWSFNSPAVTPTAPSLSTYTISTRASPSAGGSVLCWPSTVSLGSSSSCVATANSGYTFSNWNGDCSGASSTCTLSNVTANKSVTALFSSTLTPTTYSISATASPTTGGSVTCSPNPVSSGSSSTCSATANNGYTFASWSGDCSGMTSTCTLSNVTASKSVTAAFSVKSTAPSQAFDVIAGTSGDVSNLTLDLALYVDSANIGTQGNIYLGAWLPLSDTAGMWFFNDSNGWINWTGSSIPAYFTGTLPASKTFPILRNSDVRDLANVELWSGYGSDVSDMVNRGHVKLGYTIPPISSGSGTSSSFGTEGGTVSLDGLLVTVPKGATSGQVSIQISPAQADQTFAPGISVLSDAYKVVLSGDLQLPASIRMKAKSIPSAGELVMAAIVDDSATNMFDDGPLTGMMLREVAIDADGYVISLPAQNIPVTRSSRGVSTRSFTIYLFTGYRMRSSEHFNIRYPKASCNSATMDEWLQYAETAYSKLVNDLYFETSGLGMSVARQNIDVMKLKEGRYGELGFHTWTLGLLNNFVLEFNMSMDFCNLPTTEQKRDVEATIGHEFFHAIQNTYDPAPALVKSIIGSRGLCLYDASSTWFEGEMISSPTYLGKPALEAIDRSFYSDGLGYGCKTDPQEYGYGLSTFIRHLTNKYGLDLVLSLWGKIWKGGSSTVPVDAMLSANIRVTDEWKEFAEKVALGSLTPESIPASNGKLIYKTYGPNQITGNMYQLSAKKFLIDFKSLGTTMPTCKIKINQAADRYSVALYAASNTSTIPIKIANADQEFTASSTNIYSLLVINLDDEAVTENGARYGRLTPVDITVDCGGINISKISPNAGVAGNLATITGTNFGYKQGTVTFNGTPATQIEYWDNTQINVIVPTGASSGNVVVTTFDKQNDSIAFHITAINITKISPDSGVAGNKVTITGSGFGAKQGAITFNGTSATVNSWSDTKIDVIVPAGASNGNVAVTTYDKQSASIAFQITSGTISGTTPSMGVSYGANLLCPICDGRIHATTGSGAWSMTGDGVELVGVNNIPSVGGGIGISEVYIYAPNGSRGTLTITLAPTWDKSDPRTNPTEFKNQGFGPDASYKMLYRPLTLIPWVTGYEGFVTSGTTSGFTLKIDYAFVEDTSSDTFYNNFTVESGIGMYYDIAAYSNSDGKLIESASNLGGDMNTNIVFYVRNYR